MCAIALLSGQGAHAWSELDEDAVLADSEDDNDRVACDWWDGRERAHPSGCSTLAASRISHVEVERARARALACAMDAGVECVLSTELGVDVPSAFLYTEEDVGMQMIIAPRVLHRSDATQRIEMRDPRTNAPVTWLDMATNVTVEYLIGGSRSLRTSTLQGDEARCIQALRFAIADDCWNALD